ncbi:MAG TPA: Wzz/FepE/Etk N-terminal domain-containing protein [Candidatus Udaeobacter sp.]
MAEMRREQQLHYHSGIGANDVLFALFRRKWTIIFWTLLGTGVAAAFYLLYPPSYQSDAKLLVRYVLERSAVDPIDNTTKPNVTQTSAKSVDSIIDAEVQILTSWDLAVQVAEAIGAKRLGAASTEGAAGGISSNLTVTSNKGSDVILVSYKSSDPQLAPLVLQELLSRYFVKHLEVHRSAGAFDFVTQQTDQVRARLNQTEDALKKLRDKAGIVSNLDDASDALNDETADIQKQLNAAEADLAEQQSIVKQTGEKKANSWTTRKSKPDKTPGAEKAFLAGKQAKVDALKARLTDVQQRTKQLNELRPQIQELERKREMDANNYKYFAASLEKARIDEALDPSKMPNISAVQRPSPPSLDRLTRQKIALGLAGGGLGLGIALALLRGLIMNRTIGRPLELESRLQIPLMLSIPYRNGSNGHKALPPNGSSPNSQALSAKGRKSKLAPWDAGHFIRPYCDAIRDRLGLYFELNHLTHRPKLVGVTGFSETAGTSSLAAGLAASLSETDDGKVLLVDVNLGPEEVAPFFKGKPAYPLNSALKPSGEMRSAADNLYLATVGSPSSGGPAQLGLKKFFDMMPNMKASDFDYIIFDMPPLRETSPTWGMAAFMDKVLLVVEAERNSRDVVKRGYSKLVEERDNVSVLVNKARSRIPRFLNGES